ncbi:MAG TPA: tetratricopeptide repeat protein [Terriglobales bacterium]
MKSLSVLAVLSFFGFSIPLLAQLPDVASGGSVTANARAAVGSQRVAILGKVISEDGTAPAAPGDVVLKCGNEERARAGIDSQGGFSIQVNVASDDNASPKMRELDPAANPGMDALVHNWSNCELETAVNGYRSDPVHLAGTSEQIVQVGSIIVHPVTATAGPGAQKFTISVASLQAPDKAKKAFEKGEEQAKKGRWAAACDYFRRAVQAYPRYAVAWLELGRAQARQNSFLEAQQSFHEAVSKDSHLTEGYVELARVAIAQKEWKELADATEHLVEAYPNSEPQFWFFNGVANFNLGNKAEAEHSAERGLRLDTNHSVPQLEYLYGLALAVRGDYKNAEQHIQAYLRMAPNAPDVQDAQTKLAEVQKLATPVQQSHEVDFSLH